MPGPIFLHYQTYSRKSNKAGNTIRQIIAEAMRESEYSAHVLEPTPPRIILGTPSTFEADHAAHLEDRATKVKGKGSKEHRRAIRQDRHTLATVIASYPLTHQQIADGGPDAVAHHKRWEEDTVKWVRDQYGDQLKVVLAHDDESHPHIHFWLLPDDPDARADTLHPGKVAKHMAEGLARTGGATDRQAVKAGNVALKAAMRDTLDTYWQEVGQPLDMTRDGPKRQRLTRAEWTARKEEAKRVGETLRRAEHAGIVVQDAQAVASKVIQDAEAVDAQTKADRADFNRKAKAWVKREKDTLAVRQGELDQIAEGLGVRVAALETEKAEVRGIRKTLNSLLDQAETFLRLPGIPAAVRRAGAALFNAAGRPVPEQETETSHGGRVNLTQLRKRAGLNGPVPALPKEPTPEAPTSSSGPSI